MPLCRNAAGLPGPEQRLCIHSPSFSAVHGGRFRRPLRRIGRTLLWPTGTTTGNRCGNSASLSGAKGCTAPRIATNRENAPGTGTHDPRAAPHGEGTGPSQRGQHWDNRDRKDSKWNDRDRDHPGRKHDKDRLERERRKDHQYNRHPQPRHDDGQYRPEELKRRGFDDGQYHPGR